MRVDDIVQQFKGKQTKDYPLSGHETQSRRVPRTEGCDVNVMLGIDFDAGSLYADKEACGIALGAKRVESFTTSLLVSIYRKRARDMESYLLEFNDVAPWYGRRRRFRRSSCWER